MTPTVTYLWRHPIKSHGREALDTITLNAGQTMPGDRVWAVAHEASKADNSQWAPCPNFSRGAKAPALMAISSQTDPATGQITLTHPDRPALRFDPKTDEARFIDWVRPLMPHGRAASTHLVQVPGRGMTDTDYPSISIGNLATHRAISQKLGQDLSELRWRINIWLDGLAPWEEFDWVGKDIRIGGVRLAIREPITRCLATTANPETGARDADTLGALKSWGHQDMGVYAEVIESGDINLGDPVQA